MTKPAIVIIIVLLVLFLGALVFIGYTQYQTYKQSKQTEQQEEQYLIAQQGAQYGYTYAVGQLYQEAAKCQPVPVTFENQTVNMIALECPWVQEAFKIAQAATQTTQ